MANQQVDEALNDYFSDLLGGADGDSASEQVEQAPAADSPEDKASLNKLAEPDNTDASDSESNSDSKLEQRAKTAPIEPKNTQASSAAIASASASKGQESISGANYSGASIAQSTPKAQKLSEPQSFTGSSSYSEHKKKLEKMLQQVTALNSTNTDAEAAPIQAKVEAKPQAKTVSEPKQAQVETPQSLSEAAPSISTENVTENLAESGEITDSESFLAQVLSSQWNENGRPEWAQEPFDILLVEVNGLQLAVPLVALGQIQEIEEEITPLFGQSDWFMGLQKTPTGNVKVVNTAQFIMPERYKDQHNYKFVISINGLQWGLAVDNINQPISIDPEAIRWRAKRESRPWMAGMVKDHMCVLLDIPKVGEILQDQDKNRVD